MEARKTHLRHMAGTAVGMLIKPSRGLRDDIIRAGGKPKDHAKENRKKLRELEKAKKAKKAEEEKPEPPLFKLKRFESIPSKLHTRPSVEHLTTAESSRPSTAASTTPKKNFIQINSIKAKTGTPRTPPPPEPTEPQRKTRTGEVPKYLQHRRSEWERREQERLEQILADKIPPGMMVLPEHDRLETLRALHQKRDELVDALSRFPMIVETIGMKRRKAAIEAELKEIDDACEIFSRKEVYVPKEIKDEPPMEELDRDEIPNVMSRQDTQTDERFSVPRAAAGQVAPDHGSEPLRPAVPRTPRVTEQRMARTRSIGTGTATEANLRRDGSMRHLNGRQEDQNVGARRMNSDKSLGRVPALRATEPSKGARPPTLQRKPTERELLPALTANLTDQKRPSATVKPWEPVKHASTTKSVPISRSPPKAATERPTADYAFSKPQHDSDPPASVTKNAAIHTARAAVDREDEHDIGVPIWDMARRAVNKNYNLSVGRKPSEGFS
ncbi:Enkurin domain-containing protein 1 [Gaertneriomyces sp. JEL0708]|nr:Enkurin domain-containing protein 1 [Gaertneriomyces sp. JEL0708]